ncbi:MAG: hypothetical protein WCF57_11395 [Pyrinomonadaceae bacterium]
MWRSILKVMAATALFGVAHSVLASRGAKKTAERLVGERWRNALYRPFYLAQSVATLSALALYASRMQGRTLYRIRGPLAALMRTGQAASLGYAVYAAREVGIARMLGLPGSLALLRGDVDVPPEPEAQGPALNAYGKMGATGPFALSRHPLNLAPLMVFWLEPEMTTRLAAFNCVATLYLILGSAHEEMRLRAAYGNAYVEYQKSGVPFYVPSIYTKALSASSGTLPDDHPTPFLE